MKSDSPGQARKTREFATRINKGLTPAEMRSNIAVSVRASNRADSSASIPLETASESSAGSKADLFALLQQVDRAPAFMRGDAIDYEAVVQSGPVSKAIAKDKLRKSLLDIPSDDWTVRKTARRFRTVDPPVPLLDSLPVQLKECARAYVCDAVTVERQFAAVTQSTSAPPALDGDGPLTSYEIDSAARGSVVSPATLAAEEAKRISTISRQITEAETAEALSRGADAESSKDWQWVLKRWDKKTTPAVYAEKRKCGGARVPLLSVTDPLEPQQFRLDRLGPSNGPFADKSVRQTHVATVDGRLTNVGFRYGHTAPRFLVYADGLVFQHKITPEPLFGSICLYDVKHQKQVSELFHFDLTSNEAALSLLREGAREEAEVISALKGKVPKELENYVAAAKQRQDAGRQPTAENLLAGDPRIDIELIDRVTRDPKLLEMEAVSRLSEVAAVRQLIRDGRTRAPQALFSHTYGDLDNVVVVVRVEKVLEGDPQKIIEQYMNSKFDESKEGRARASAVTRLCRRLGRYRMPFAWAAVPLQDAVRFCVGDLVPAVELDIYAQPEKWSEDELMKCLIDLQNKPHERTLMKKLKKIPGSLRMKAQELKPKDHCPHTLTPTLLQVRPWVERDALLTLEVREFPPRPIFRPHRDYHHDLYIYPRAVTFEKYRNIAVKVQVFAGAAGDAGAGPLACLYGKSPDQNKVSELMCAVTYHNKSPQWYDEIKVQLPENLDPSHHVLFTFYHIKCKDKPKKEKSAADLIGYAWHQLVNSTHRLKTGDGGEYELAVVQDRLPAGYLSDANVKAKWVDGGKKIFRVGIRLESTVLSSDMYVQGFMLQMPDFLSVASGSKSAEINLATAVRNLKRAEPLPLIQFLPTILNQLLFILQNYDRQHQSQGALVRETFDAVSHLVMTAHNNMETAQTRSDDMEMFVKHLFSIRGLSGDSEIGAFMLHKELVYWLTEAMSYQHRQEAWAKETHEACVMHSWFFFELINKSLAQHIATAGGKGIVDAVFVQNVRSLLLTMVNMVLEQGVDATTCAPRLLSAVAFFLRDLLSYIRRGDVFGIIHDIFKLLHMNIIASRPGDSLGRDERACYRLDMLEILCSHEHYVALNLPLDRESDTDSEISASYLSQHYLSGLLLAEVELALQGGSAERRKHALAILRRLMTTHDSDPRYQSESARARVYQLYFPLLPLILEYDPLFIQLRDQQVSEAFKNTLDLISGVRSTMTPSKPTIVLDEFQVAELLAIFLHVCNAVDLRALRKWWANKVPKFLQKFMDMLKHCVLAARYVGQKEMAKLARIVDNAAVDPTAAKKHKEKLDSLAARYTNSGGSGSGPDLLASPNDRLGRKPSQTTRQMRTERVASTAAAAEARTAAASAVALRSNSSNARAGSIARSYHGGGAGLRNFSAAGKSGGDGISPSAYGLHRCLSIGHLANSESAGPAVSASVKAAYRCSETVLTVLSVLDAFMEDFRDALEDMRRANELTSAVFGVLHAVMHSQLADDVVIRMFEILQNFVYRFPMVVFQGRSEICAHLCRGTFKFCASSVRRTREIASAFMYLLMFMNNDYNAKKLKQPQLAFSRVKVQATIALSQVVKEITDEDEYVKKSLANIILMARRDKDMRDSEFQGSVIDLSMNLLAILKNTSAVRMFQQEDNEMSVDLHYNIAESYKDSPRLRVEWLLHLGTIHRKFERFAEAAFCSIHAAAIVAEYLFMMDTTAVGLPSGAKAFESLSKNVREESLCRSEHKKGVDEDTEFEVEVLESFLRQSLADFEKARMFEYVVEVYKLLIPMYEHSHKYDCLAAAYSSTSPLGDVGRPTIGISQCYEQIVEMDKSHRRFFGTFFRVGYYCKGPYLPADIRNKVFVTREASLTKLGELSLRLKGQYEQYCREAGVEEVVLLNDSKVYTEADIAQLHPKKVYIQIIFLEPSDVQYDATTRENKTEFEKNTRIKDFVFETPFTDAGKARGDIAAQRLRRTTVKVEKYFPYIKKRLEVVKTDHVELSPIEVAIDSIQRKVNDLSALVKATPLNIKLVQLQLQGCVSVSVNEGPGEIANVFLKKGLGGPSDKGAGAAAALKKHEQQLKNLRRKFVVFLGVCEEALMVNEQNISQSQMEYHRSLKDGYKKMDAFIRPLAQLNKKAAAPSVRDSYHLARAGTFDAEC